MLTSSNGASTRQDQERPQQRAGNDRQDAGDDDDRPDLEPLPPNELAAPPERADRATAPRAPTAGTRSAQRTTSQIAIGTRKTDRVSSGHDRRRRPRGRRAAARRCRATAGRPARTPTSRPASISTIARALAAWTKARVRSVSTVPIPTASATRKPPPSRPGRPRRCRTPEEHRLERRDDDRDRDERPGRSRGRAAAASRTSARRP